MDNTPNNRFTSEGNLISNFTTESVTMQPSFQQISNEEDDTALHKTAVLIIMSILIFISVSISGAVLVFCKKKNSVFIYQKPGQIEKDYEMDDMNTDMSSSETEPARSKTFPRLAKSPIKTHYKFIPKSKTFSGIDSQKICQLGKSAQYTNSLGLSNSFCTSSSPSLNFQSLTIKVDVEPCLESKSLECLHNLPALGNGLNSHKIQKIKCLQSSSLECFKDFSVWTDDSLDDYTLWDNDSSSWETENSFKYSPVIDTTMHMTKNIAKGSLETDMVRSSDNFMDVSYNIKPSTYGTITNFDADIQIHSASSSLTPDKPPEGGVSHSNSEDTLNTPLLSFAEIV